MKTEIFNVVCGKILLTHKTYMYTLYFGVRRNLNKSTDVVHIKVTVPRNPKWETIVCTPCLMWEATTPDCLWIRSQPHYRVSQWDGELYKKNRIDFFCCIDCKIISSETTWKVFYFYTNDTNRFNLQVLTLLYMYDMYQNTLSTKAISELALHHTSFLFLKKELQFVLLSCRLIC